MTDAIVIEHTDATADVIRRAFPSYTGRKFRLVVSESMNIQGTTWSGGSRSVFRLLDLATGRFAELSMTASRKPGDPFGWIPDIDGNEVRLRPGFAVVESVTYRGKDLGLRATVHPDNAAKLLPVETGANLDENALKILGYLSQWRSCPERKSAIEALGGGVALDALALGGYVKRSKNGATQATVKGRNTARNVRI